MTSNELRMILYVFISTSKSSMTIHGSRGRPQRPSAHSFSTASVLFIAYCCRGQAARTMLCWPRTTGNHHHGTWKTLSNPAILEHVSVDGQRGSDDQLNLLRFPLAGRQAVTGQRLCSSQVIIISRWLLLDLVQDVVSSLDSAFLTPIKRSFARNPESETSL